MYAGLTRQGVLVETPWRWHAGVWVTGGHRTYMLHPYQSSACAFEAHAAHPLTAQGREILRGIISHRLALANSPSSSARPFEVKQQLSHPHTTPSTVPSTELECHIGMQCALLDRITVQTTHPAVHWLSCCLDLHDVISLCLDHVVKLLHECICCFLHTVL